MSWSRQDPLQTIQSPSQISLWGVKADNCFRMNQLLFPSLTKDICNEEICPLAGILFPLLCHWVMFALSLSFFIHERRIILQFSKHLPRTHDAFSFLASALNHWVLRIWGKTSTHTEKKGPPVYIDYVSGRTSIPCLSALPPPTILHVLGRVWPMMVNTGSPDFFPHLCHLIC